MQIVAATAEFDGCMLIEKEVGLSVLRIAAT